MINTLWITSLVLSLAAALFGILAKQWCCEYLRWHNTIQAARDNLLIRQVRFEAWDRWQVGAFIASIPAFLEVALVLVLRRNRGMTRQMLQGTPLANLCT